MAEGRPPQAHNVRKMQQMTAGRQLKLVKDAPPAHGHASDPVRQVFEHWVFMFGLHPGRTKLDAHRRAAINGAIALYGLSDAMLAVEGMAAVPLGDKPESMREAMREIDWFLATAKRIERCLRYGDQLRAAAAQPAPAAGPEATAEPVDQAEVAAQRQRLRDLAERFRGMHG
jgi:hypothetical protein